MHSKNIQGGVLLQLVLSLRSYIGLSAMIMAPMSWAVDFSTQVLNTSTSGKTILLDRMPMYAFEQDYKQDEADQTPELAILVLKERAPRSSRNEKKIFYRPLAQIVRVEPFKNHSVWMIKKRYSEHALTKGQKLWLYTEAELLQGRRELEVNSQRLVLNKSQSAQEALAPSLPMKNEAGIKKIRENYSDARQLDVDAQVVDLDVWENHSYNEDQLVPTAIYRSQRIDKFKRSARVELFEHMVTQLLGKYNDPQFDSQEFYDDHSYNPITGDFGLKTLGGNFYEKKNNEWSLDEKDREKLRKEVAAKGDRWSEHYSDKELSELVKSIGVLSERERREWHVGAGFKFQLYGELNYALLENKNFEDSSSASIFPYGLAVGLEWHVFRQLEILRRLTLESALLHSQESISLGGHKASAQQTSVAVGANWHFLNFPDALESIIIFTGLHWRYGQASLDSNTLGQSSVYGVSSFPEFRVGTKYHFSNEWGVRFSFNYASLSLDRSSDALLAPDLPSTERYTEGRLALALSRSF